MIFSLICVHPVHLWLKISNVGALTVLDSSLAAGSTLLHISPLPEDGCQGEGRELEFHAVFAGSDGFDFAGGQIKVGGLFP